MQRTDSERAMRAGGWWALALAAALAIPCMPYAVKLGVWCAEIALQHQFGG